MSDTKSKSFDEWSFEQCVKKGHKIDGIKGEDGLNHSWVNTTTKEVFVLPNHKE